jgi:DNA-binding MarR family transcriptional regulator
MSAAHRSSLVGSGSADGAVLVAECAATVVEGEGWPLGVAASRGAAPDVHAAAKNATHARANRRRDRTEGTFASMIRDRTISYGSVLSVLASTSMGDASDDALGWVQRPDRETSLLFDVFVLGNRARTLVVEAMRDADLRPDEYAAYSVVFEEGPITLTRLAGRLGLPLTTVADHVHAMTERRHVRRQAHPTDQRSTLLSLTAQGLRAHRRTSRSFERADRALRERLAPIAEAEARDVLRGIADAAQAATAAPPVRRAG